MTKAHSSPTADNSVTQEAARITQAVVDLTRNPGLARDRQLVYGDAVKILNRTETHHLLTSDKDGYRGWVTAEAISPTVNPTHKVTARATHAYAASDFKSGDRMTLSFGSRLAALSETPTFIETELGFVPRQHLHPVDVLATDPAAVAEIFLGTPYLWGGNSHLGLDCSGLVQAACLACGISCPGDSDQQVEALGVTLPPDAKLQRNDLMFWKGHVAIVYDAETFIHANAGHMSTVLEPIDAAVHRIEAQGDGKPTQRRRLT